MSSAENSTSYDREWLLERSNANITVHTFSQVLDMVEEGSYTIISEPDYMEDTPVPKYMGPDQVEDRIEEMYRLDDEDHVLDGQVPVPVFNSMESAESTADYATQETGEIYIPVRLEDDHVLPIAYEGPRSFWHPEWSDVGEMLE